MAMIARRSAQTACHSKTASATTQRARHLALTHTGRAFAPKLLCWLAKD